LQLGVKTPVLLFFLADRIYGKGMKTHASLPSLALLTATSLVLVSCGTGGGTTPDNSDPPAPSTVTSTASPSPATQQSRGAATTTEGADETPADEPGTSALGSPDMSVKMQPPGGEQELMVTGIRVGDHEGFDRVVFDLAGEGEPGWYAELTDTPAQQGSGFPVEYEGATALYLTIQGTPYPTGTDRDADLIDHGPHPGGGGITGINFSSVFEAHSEFIIGLDGRYPFSVTYLEGPKRVVVDFVRQ